MSAETAAAQHDETIVTKIDSLPAPTAFTLEPAKKSKEGLDLEVSVLAELLPGPGLVKRGYVKPNIPGFGAFELRCDEGTSIGGTDTAPAPLSYLAAGIAFCFLTHLKGYAEIERLRISSIRIEQRMKFQSRIPGMTTAKGASRHMEGLSKGVETFVHIESDETPEAIAQMVETAEKACMAAQTVVNAVPAATHVIRNGREI
ncbi:OsmC family protein [Denitrobaculum tricleocarpae]|uniref:OsmC family protein n=1 Tax=Denitrobaculum tricleocarpae TaxID=2591009 RepID=A0A545TF07_9PROT|nr:OsmC family protein [Denitrobaculum tricleocarpae]TQV75809.1 OsmC family protein [Denitrobaculum tricleocarpae]